MAAAGGGGEAAMAALAAAHQPALCLTVELEQCHARVAYCPNGVGQPGVQHGAASSAVTDGSHSRHSL